MQHLYTTAGVLLILCVLASGAEAAVAPASGITFVNGHFRRADGSLFVPLGGYYGNYLPEVRDGILVGSRPFQEVDEKGWREWFALLQENGCNTVRLFCRAHTQRDGNPVEWTLDAGGHVNPELMAIFERYFAVGREYGVSFLTTVLSEPRGSIYSHWAPILFAHEHYAAQGWEWNPFVPSNIGTRRLLKTHRDYFTDPDAVRLQKSLLRDLIPRLCRNPAVFAVELYNEMAWSGQFEWESEDAEIAWSNEMIAVIEEIAPDLPACFSLAGHGITGIDPIRWGKAIRADFFSSHTYPTISGESEAMDYGASIALLHDYSAAALPNWPGESGVLDAGVPDPLRRLALRDSIWLTLASGGAGYLQWPTDRQPVAHLVEYRQAAEFLKGERWLAGRLAAPPVSIDLRENARFLGECQDRDKKLASPLFESLRQYEKRSLDSGVPLAFRLGKADVDGATYDAGAFDPVRPLFPVPEGYQARCVTTPSRSAGLLYLRNAQHHVAGGYHLRTQAPREFSLRANLPPGRYRFEVLDLDTGQTERVVARCPGLVHAPRQTTSDFAVRFRRL